MMYAEPRTIKDDVLIGRRLEDVCEALFFWEPFIILTVSSSLFSFSFQEDLMETSSDEDESVQLDEKRSGSVVDMEDLGNIMNSVKKAKVRLCSTDTVTPHLALTDD